MWLLVVFACTAGVVVANNSDRFNYRETNTSEGYNDFGPEDWSKVTCSNLDQCLGWPDKAEFAVFPYIGNNCLWCPDTGNSCGLHRQSPINLDRHLAVPGDSMERQCIDTHWMKYDGGGACTWEDLVKNNAFTIERHALKVKQPLKGSKSDNNVVLNCVNPQGLRNFGRMGMSHDSFPFWYLSHIDFHVPSEHTQHGKRYSAEAHIYHFLPEGSNGNGQRNQIFAPTILFEAYDNAQPYGFLDKLICQWRIAEDARRAECGLPSVASYYPGCVSNRRGVSSNSSTSSARRTAAAGSSTRRVRESHYNLRSQQNLESNQADSRSPKLSALDVVLGSEQAGEDASRWKLEMDPSNFRPPDDIDWDAFIESQHEQELANDRHRHLANYDHVGPWHNYFLMLGVKTEYYFRYQGSLTFPPCYGPYTKDTKSNSTHFRVLKDPIRVHPRQITEMERLLAHRIAPLDDPNYSCQPDTAGVFVDGSTDRVNVARPLQSVSSAHYAMFCECQRWTSHWKEDKAWCELDLETRLFQQPYNFKSEGF